MVETSERAFVDQDFAARAAALAERANGERPTTWRPNDPAKGHPQLLVGVVVDKEERLRGYDDSDGVVDVITLRTPEEGREWVLWLFHAVLARELARVEIADLVAVKYEGRIAPREGRAGYESYRVVVEREGAAGSNGTEPRPLTRSLPIQPTEELRCEQCGHEEPEHAAGCPLEIPF